MSTKQSPALNLYVIAGLLVGLILFGLVAIFLLDRALLADRVSIRESSGENKAAANRGNRNNNTMLFELTPASPLTGLDLESLKTGNVDQSAARAALKSASGSTIQKAVRAKTGKNVSLEKIEKGRQKALSSEGQSKINEAMKRRGDIDISKLRDKLKM